MGLSERGRCKRAWERDAPFWYLGSMSRKEANDILTALKPGAWRIRVEERRQVELVLCHKSPEGDTILQHSINPVNPHKWVDGPFRSMVNGKLALLYYKARAQPGERPPAIDANGDYLLEVVDLDEILEVLCRQHNLSYPLRGDPWGARPYRTIAVADRAVRGDVKHLIEGVQPLDELEWRRRVAGGLGDGVGPVGRTRPRSRRKQ